LVGWKELEYKFKDKVRELAIERHSYEHRRNWQQYVGSDLENIEPGPIGENWN
jgi:hypothetical protein